MKNLIPFVFSLLLFTVSMNRLFPQDTVWNRIQPIPQEHSLYCVRQVPGTETLVTVGSGATIMYSDDAGETWDTELNPAGLPNNTLFLSVNFYDDQNGYAVANYGRIIRTTNGGQNWELVYDNMQDSLKTGRADIYVFNPQTAIVVGFNRLVLKTADGGESWNTWICPEGFYPKSIDFINGDTGYIVGSSDTAVILKTVDSGATWTIQPFANGLNTSLYDIFFTGDSTGIISALKPNGMQDHTTLVYKTYDAGKSWDIVHKQTGTDEAGEIGFKDDLHGAIRIFSWSNSFLYTQDGGNTWAPDNDAFFFNYTPCYSFYYGPEYMIGVGRFGIIGRLNSDQNSWEMLTENYEYNQCTDAVFTSDNIGYAHYLTRGGGVTWGGIIKTTNGGSEWFNLDLNYFDGDFSFINDNTGFAVKYEINSEDDLETYQTNNGGNSWTLKDTFVAPDWFDYRDPFVIKYFDESNGLLAVTGKIYKTSNIGPYWKNIYSSDDSHYMTDIEYISADTFLVSSYSWHEHAPILIWSYDGGESLVFDTLDQSLYTPNSICLEGANTLFIPFENTNKILKSTDLGETWYPTVINDTNYSSYNDIFFPTPDTGYAVGSGNYTTMLKTTDGGETWDPVDIPCTSGLSHVYFLDEEHGFVFGNNGVIMETLTGGVVGNEENSFTPNEQIFTVAPNPFSNQIRIELKQPGTGKIAIEIFNLNGKQVYHNNIPENITIHKININLTSLPSGIYFCRVYQGNKVSTRKIVKL